MNFLWKSRKHHENRIKSLSLKILNWPITRRQILDSSKLKEFVDDNFKFDKSCRKLSKWVENTVGKGETARYEQFLLFPQCFLLNQIIVSTFVHIFDIISLYAAEFEEPKIAVSGNGLNGTQYT